MKPISLVVGSVGFDHVLNIMPSFKQELPIENGVIDKVNMTFISSKDSQIIYGGTGSNVAYSHALINKNVILFSAVGNDFKATMGRDLASMGVDDRTVVFDRDTARSLQITDTIGEQMIVWQPNAYEYIGDLDLSESISNEELQACDHAIFSPGTPASTLRHLKNYRSANSSGTAYFDPGQMVNHYSNEVFSECCKLSNVILINDVEMKKVEKAFGLKIDDLVSNFALKVIITIGEKGSILYDDTGKVEVKPYSEGIDETTVLEGTGAGDAFRGAMLAAINHGLSLKAAMKVASVMGSLCVRYKGGQLHKITWEDALEKSKSL